VSSAPHRWAAWLALATLAACATLEPGAEQPMFSGRLSLQVQAQPPRAESAHFELSGGAQRGRLALSTPLGTRIGEARWMPGEALLVAAGGHETRYDDMDALTRALLGEALPVAALFDWLAGRPWPGAPAQPLSAAGFAQLGWRIDLAEADAGRMVARRDAAPAATLRVQLDGPQRKD
jgi:outer membrane lipoprotein LolB